MLKKIFTFLIIFLFTLNSTYALMVATDFNREKIAADFLSYKDIINTQETESGYKLDNKITRREMAKVTLNLSGISVSSSCLGYFTDLDKSDWGCKYAEAGARKDFFARNLKFNPNNSISKIEALKMVMKGKKIVKENSDDWKIGYVKAAVKSGLLEEEFIDYNTEATRGWIFIMAKHAIEYSENDEDIRIIEELLNN